jgi:hypothetical protein
VQRKPYKTFAIPLEIYKTGVRVIISEDRDRVRRHIKTHFGNDYEVWDDTFPEGKVIYTEGWYPILWMAKFSKSNKDLAILNHEIMHLTCRILAPRGILQSDTNEEAYAYLSEYLTNQILNKLTKR